MDTLSLRHRGRVDLDTGELRFRLTQRVGNLLSNAKNLRDIEGTKDAAKTDYQAVAGLPMTTVMEIRDKYGLDVMNMRRGDWPRLFKIVEQNYPKLKYVNKRIG